MCFVQGSSALQDKHFSSLWLYRCSAVPYEKPEGVKLFFEAWRESFCPWAESTDVQWSLFLPADPSRFRRSSRRLWRVVSGFGEVLREDDGSLKRCTSRGANVQAYGAQELSAADCTTLTSRGESLERAEEVVPRSDHGVCNNSRHQIRPFSPFSEMIPGLFQGAELETVQSSNLPGGRYESCCRQLSKLCMASSVIMCSEVVWRALDQMWGILK